MDGNDSPDTLVSITPPIPPAPINKEDDGEGL